MVVDPTNSVSAHGDAEEQDQNASSSEFSRDLIVQQRIAKLLKPLIRNPESAPRAAAQVVAAMEMYAGPIPHPMHFKGYEDVLPGSASRILNMAEVEQRHRHRTDTLSMVYPYLGLVFGFLGFVAVLALAGFLAIHNHETIALIALGIPVFGVIGWFVHSRNLLGQASRQSPPSNQSRTPKRR